MRELIYRSAVLLVLIMGQYVWGYSQVNYATGYIISLEGDTLHGFIQQTDRYKFAHACTFKSTEEAEPQQFSAVDISEFFTNDRLYTSQLFPGNKSYFAETIIRGIINLYQFQPDANNEIYLVEKGESGLIPLWGEISDTALVIAGYVMRHEIENSQYKKTLFRLTADCFIDTKLVEDIDKVQWQRNDLTRFLVAYHACVDAPINYQRKKNLLAPTIHLGAFVAWASYNPTFEDNSPRYEWLANPDFETYTQLTGGVNVDLHFPNITRHFFLRGELIYTQMVFEGDYTTFFGFNDYRTTLKLNYIKVPVTINYLFSATKWQPYAYLGFGRSFPFASNNFRVSNGSPEPVYLTGFRQDALLIGLGATYFFNSDIGISMDIRQETGNVVQGRVRKQGLATTMVKVGVLF